MSTATRKVSAVSIQVISVTKSTWIQGNTENFYGVGWIMIIREENSMFSIVSQKTQIAIQSTVDRHHEVFFEYLLKGFTSRRQTEDVCKVFHTEVSVCDKALSVVCEAQKKRTIISKTVQYGYVIRLRRQHISDSWWRSKQIVDPFLFRQFTIWAVW